MADNDHMDARKLQQEGRILSLESILVQLRPIYPGRVLDVELEQENGQIVYEFEILGKDGVIREVYVDASNGKVIKTEEDD